MTRPPNRARPSRLSIRARLTLVYGGLFLLAGVLLLGVTYALVAQRLPGEGEVTVSGLTAQRDGSGPVVRLLPGLLVAGVSANSLTRLSGVIRPMQSLFAR